jgi:hypothetical protein
MLPLYLASEAVNSTLEPNSINSTSSQSTDMPSRRSVSSVPDRNDVTICEDDDDTDEDEDLGYDSLFGAFTNESSSKTTSASQPGGKSTHPAANDLYALSSIP